MAKLVADASGLPYLDTGAMYRCVALQTILEKIDPSDEFLVGVIAEKVEINVDGSRCILNGNEVSDAIRTPEIAGIVSVIAAHTPVRNAMRVQQQRWIESHGGGVVEGRDIGTVVFPHAELKIFLTASPEERASRRVGQNGGDIAEVAANIAERDRIDSQRADSPLRPASDAIIVDSTGVEITQVVATIIQHFEMAKR